jgi:hypothetical protein
MNNDEIYQEVYRQIKYITQMEKHLNLIDQKKSLAKHVMYVNLHKHVCK